MSAFKKLNRQDVYVSDYVANKSWVASGSLLNDYGIEVLRGFSGSTPGYPYPSDQLNGRYQSLVYNSIYHSFLADSLGTGIFSGSRDLSLTTTLTLSESRQRTGEVGVVSIPKDVYGTGIKPGTVVLQPLQELEDRYYINGYARGNDWDNLYVEDILYWYNSKPLDLGDYVEDEGDYIDEETIGDYVDNLTTDFQLLEIIDDGEGRLIISGSELSYTKPARYVGDVIYNQGLIILTDIEVARYYSTYARIKVNWKSKLPIYTYNVHCTVRESELNHTYNPSAITGSDARLRSNITGSYFKPYVTTIGLYNDANELIAVAKTNRPVPRSENVDMTFVVKLDI
jgi:hypothetical protein